MKNAKQQFKKAFGPAVNLAFPLPLKYGVTKNNAYFFEISKGYYDAYYVTIITLNGIKRNDLNHSFDSYAECETYTNNLT